MIVNEMTLHELEQRALELMLFVNASKASIKQAKKDIDALLERIEELKKDNV
jgi:enoyl reductase-like protein